MGLFVTETIIEGQNTQNTNYRDNYGNSYAQTISCTISFKRSLIIPYKFVGVRNKFPRDDI